ncbi:MAG: ATP-binding protein [Chloroflexi bacterium]|nr:ATP-binding protein [Chloroflexota bacterium]MBP8059283.1 ATP-binding protein [Chloroflexota bacterium]
MINLLFNPFDSAFDEFQPADLGKLLTVAEGWYIEYKGGLVSTKSIAKSLAAFANHYGGWIFYGVGEAGGGTHCAGSFPGIDQLSVPNFINDIKNAAKDIINPSPYFEYRRIDGPCDEIGLASGKSIVVVGVPIGPDAPYIHNDGKIYRRIADSSDPKPETDKNVLDNLWNRRQQARSRLAEFLEETPILSEDEDKVSYLDLFLLPDPLGYANQVAKITFNEFVEFLKEPPPENKPSMYLKFDNFFTMADGMIARHIYDNNPYNLTLTWKFYRNGASVISIPFSSAIVDEVIKGRWLSGYNQERAFINLLQQGNYNASFVNDINPHFSVIVALLEQNRCLLEKTGIRGPYFAKAILRNIWRRVPFVDTDLFIGFVNLHGIPVVQFDKAYAPPGRTFETLVQLHDIRHFDEANGANILTEDAGRILGPIFNSLGLPRSALLSESEEINEDNSLFGAGNRAVEVGKHRRRIFG